MLENLLSIRVTSYGTIIEEVEIFCLRTGSRRHLLAEYTVDGLYRSVEVSTV